MESNKTLTEAEFAQMLKLLKRYVTSEMDQWELWTFDTHFSKIYVNISMQPSAPEEAYIDMNQMIERPYNEELLPEPAAEVVNQK